LRGKTIAGLSGLIFASAFMLGGAIRPAVAEVSEVKIAMQYGLGHLPVMVMRDKKLVEKHLKEEGLTSTTKYFQLAGSAAMNDALLSGS
ncbi:hypothetical protein ABK046_47240, partial [Streptomyces caeruleatus]